MCALKRVTERTISRHRRAVYSSTLSVVYILTCCHFGSSLSNTVNLFFANASPGLPWIYLLLLLPLVVPLFSDTKPGSSVDRITLAISFTRCPSLDNFSFA